jgi:hypothetical protein
MHRGARILQTGVWTGLLFALALVASLLLANRAPQLESFAGARNAVCCVAAFLVALIPVLRFYSWPTGLFASGVLGWLILVFAYWAAGMYFSNLENRIGKTPFELLMMGAIVYGIVAVCSWVISTLRTVRHHPMAAERQHLSHGTSPRR